MSTSRAGPSSAAAASSAGSTNPESTHQVGARQATRSRTRTRQTNPALASTSTVVAGGVPGATRRRYTSEDHPMSPHNLAARGYHTFQCLGVPFHVSKRYTYIRELGIGAYGCVALARDEVLDCKVAIKKVTRVFEREVLTRRALREVAILRHIGACHNITALLDFDTSFIEFNEVYLVLEASEADLSQIIRSGQALSDAHLQYFVAQILRGVRYTHTANIIHRDLKPGNLLVNADCHLKLCDFGLARAHAPRSVDDEPGSRNAVDEAAAEAAAACGSGPEPGQDFPASPAVEQQAFMSPNDGRANGPSPASSTNSSRQTHQQMTARTTSIRTTRLKFPGGPLTEYVATRWYRAPEIMLCYRPGYGPEIDMWSVGCILAELMGGKPIFAGKDYVDQLARINNVLGYPSERTIDNIGSERAKVYMQSLPRMPAVPLTTLYPKASPLAVDLLSKMLTWDPAERITAEEALNHPWLEAYHKSNASWTPPPPFARFAEVEMVQSLPGFLQGLRRESDEMRAELAELEDEEEQAELEAAQAEADAALAPSADDTVRQRAATITSDAKASAAAAAAAAAATVVDAKTSSRHPAHERPSSSGSSAGQSNGAPQSLFDSHCGSRRRRSLTRAGARSSSSRGISPFASPSSPMTSDEERGSPTYETDPTSASAPQSVAGSFVRRRSGKPARSDDSSAEDAASVADGGKKTSLDLDALDRSLARHGLLRDDSTASQSRTAKSQPRIFRRRAVTNAASLGPLTPRRSGSCPADDAELPVLRIRGGPYDLQGQSALLKGGRLPSGTIGVRKTDIITRPRSQQENVSDIDRPANIFTLRGHRSTPSSAAPGKNEVEVARALDSLQMREGSDASTVGMHGGSTAGTGRSSPVGA